MAIVENNLMAVVEETSGNIQTIAVEIVHMANVVVVVVVVEMVENNLAVLEERPGNRVNAVAEAKIENNWQLAETAESNWQRFVAERVANIWE